jgi:DNA-binding NtrC family response regulator
MKRLTSYSWPGNVRQLQNAIERAKVLGEDRRIELKNLPPAIISAESEKMLAINEEVDLETLNKIHVEETYKRCERNKTRTAHALGINRRSLYRLLEKYSIG